MLAYFVVSVLAIIAGLSSGLEIGVNKNFSYVKTSLISFAMALFYLASAFYIYYNMN